MKIISWLTRKHLYYTLKKHRIRFRLWQSVTHKLHLLEHLSSVEKSQLRKIASLFLHKKTITGVQGMIINDEVAVTIAAQASLPILKLGLNYYSDWVEVILYPAAFRVSQKNRDPTGVVSNQNTIVSGEAWLRGPVILSWHDIIQDIHSSVPGHNVIIHEFAHKIDMLNGRANGLPPLHHHIKLTEWTKDFTEAYTIIQQHISTHQQSKINAYAATTPAEFFAVISEYFFTAPSILIQNCPKVYQHLIHFYQQNPNIIVK